MKEILKLKCKNSTASIQELRAKRLTDESLNTNAANVEKLRLSSPVLERNLSPSLQPKT